MGANAGRWSSAFGGDGADSGFGGCVAGDASPHAHAHGYGSSSSNIGPDPGPGYGYCDRCNNDAVPTDRTC